jgi:DNA-binding NarL/FixJ family response regulator
MILLIEDDAATRQGIQALVEGAGYKVSSHGSGRAGLRVFQGETPDLVLLDLGLPDLDGVEVVRAMRAARPEVPIIVLSVITSETRILEALRAGALGYLFKEDIGRLLPALSEALAGGAPMSASVARLVLEQLRERPSQPPPSLLTGREREVLERLAEGLSYEQIALVLAVALNTVRTHVRSIYRKLDAATRLEAVLAGVKLGEIDRTWLFAEREP